MTEQQLRDVLARVVPEPPDAVADPAPVARAARRQRQALVVGVGALAAVVIAGTAIGVQALRPEETAQVADDPAIPDPYTTAPCPPADDHWESVPVDDLGRVVAVRYCARGTDSGFPVTDGPRDALVVDMDAFRAAVDAIDPADPARCAAVDVIPTDSRLLLQFADGSYEGIPAGVCQDAEVDGRVLDGNDVTQALLGILRIQRETHDYVARGDGAIDCSQQSTVSPVQPGHDHLVTAIVCTGSSSTPTPITDRGISVLDAGWQTADMSELVDPCSAGPNDGSWVIAMTDRGDTVRIEDSCGLYLPMAQGTFLLHVQISDLTDG